MTMFKIEALGWTMKSLIANNKLDVHFVIGCSNLVKIVSSSTKWTVFQTYLKEILQNKGVFTTFFISHKTNYKTDLLARSTRVYP